ncbi:branched-chain amino acid transport system substrate-binding protein [Methylobacterium sp. 174MFSha1.1]|uniref:ABC transporter substrate-binding protein n=1 Tax=Methylobacterium sp. 174MFSha1.1 TaxID=1502749 RepID=UPI0008DF8329|nr:ABC transporter substrate-binding protein [Methylobacterium sp. 174MFSha1.1]SFU48526.1 branched-chain amino acid transport system substrate-binding protein [Methylobacterium sp. 174MFSha1.1]
MLSRRSVLAGLAAAPLVPALARAADPIKVGLIIPLSGGAGRQGQDVTHAVQAMAALINEGGGVLGRPVEILVRDDESTPAIGVAKANELAAAGVAVVLEGWNSPVTLAMQSVLARAGILDITMISKADAILASASNPLAIRLNSANVQDAAIIAQYLGNKTKKARIVFVTENDAYGNGAQQGIEAEFKKAALDYTIVQTLKFPFPQTDFRVEITSIRDAKPDYVISINANEGAGLPAFLQQYAQGQVGAPVICTVGTVGPSVIETTGKAANGLHSADIYFPETEPFASNPENKRFVAQMQKQFKTEPDKFMALGAASLEVWAKAATKAGTLDRKAVAGAIRGQEIPGTIFGTVRFEPNGQMQHRHFVFTVKDGKIVVES